MTKRLTRLLLLLISTAAIALSGCSEDEPAAGGPGADAGDEDASGDDVTGGDTTTGDDVEDDASTTDTAPDGGDDDASEDAGDAADAADGDEATDADAMDDTDAEGDTADATDAADTVEPDTGTACTESGEECESPYTCIEEICRLPLSGSVRAENEFSVDHPEELTPIFNLFRGFAEDVRLMVISVEEATGEAELEAQYGGADVVTEDPLQVRWQFPEQLETIVFRPKTSEDTPLAGDTWVTDPFTYQLRAEFETTIAGRTFGGTLGLEAIDVTLDYKIGLDDEDSIVQLNGIVLRSEAEGRTMTTHEQMAAIRSLICTEDPSWVPTHMVDGVLVWTLADILDCNGTEIDTDYDGDGENDAYSVTINATFENAVLLP